jgi:hypothetical protein
MKALNVTNMKETLVNYSRSREEFDKIWDSFYRMTNMGFISFKTWSKFFEQCRGWYYDTAGDCIRDGTSIENLKGRTVWKYTPDAEYHA